MVSEMGMLPSLPEPTPREQRLADQFRADMDALHRSMRYVDPETRKKLSAARETLKWVAYDIEHPKRQGIA